MNDNEIKEVLFNAGFTATRTRHAEILDKDIQVFEYEGSEMKHGSIRINDSQDLYASNFKYLKIELSNDSLVARLYYDIFYIGCVVALREDIESFEIDSY